MLTICDSNGRFGRRQFLRIGSLGLGGLSLAGLCAARAAAGTTATEGLVTGKSVIFLFMHGGPSQIETFDPKMAAPAEIRSATGELATSIPGVTFGGTFPKLARRAKKLAIVRSFTTGDGNHDIKPVVSRDTFDANLGSMYARVAGSNHPVTGMPLNALLFPQSVDSTTGPGQTQFGRFDATGTLGSGLAPFMPTAGGNLQQDMQLKLAAERLDDRRALLSELDRVRWTLDNTSKLEGLSKLREQAFSTILGGLAGAFDLSTEDPATVARYDTAPLVRPDQISRKWANYPHYVDNGKSLGKLLLLARRLCERGCGFVTVTTNFVWDMHSDVNNAGVYEGMQYLAPPLDHAVSTFIDDVESRGLSDRILLVCCGEMGRTSRINGTGGRDHWGGLAPLLLAGGGLNMGQVIGQSTRDAAEPLSEPMRIKNLVATIMHELFDVGLLRITRGMPNEIVQAASGDPLPGLV